MPQQVTGVAITIQAGSPTTLYDVQIGNAGYQGRTIADLFDRTTFDEDHVLGNIRLKKIIGGYGALASQEFRDALNLGLSTTAGDFYSVHFNQNIDGSFEIGFTNAVGGVANQTLTVSESDMEEDTHDLEMVLKNIGAFLRKAGYHDLTTVAPNGIYAGKTAIQAVAGKVFWF